MWNGQDTEDGIDEAGWDAAMMDPATMPRLQIRVVQPARPRPRLSLSEARRLYGYECFLEKIPYGWRWQWVDGHGREVAGHGYAAGTAVHARAAACEALEDWGY